MLTQKNLDNFRAFATKESNIGGYAHRLIAVAAGLLAVNKPTRADVSRIVDDEMDDYAEGAKDIFSAMLTPGEIPAPVKAAKAKKVKPVKKVPIATLRKQVVAYIVSRTPERPDQGPHSARAKAVQKAIESHDFGCQEDAVRRAAGVLIAEEIGGGFSGHAVIRQFAAYETPSNDIVIVLGPSPESDEAFTVCHQVDEGEVEFDSDYGFQGREDWSVGATEKQIRSLISDIEEADLRKMFDFLVD